MVYKPEWYQKNKPYFQKYNKEHKPSKEVKARRSLKSRFKISPEELQKRIIAQDNCCQLCGLPFGIKGLKPIIDHDHECCNKRTTCGKCIRGIIHHKCNVLLGQLEPRLDLIDRITCYLRFYQRKVV